MGYSTEFRGKFTLNRPLDVETMDFLEKLGSTRRMMRSNALLEQAGHKPHPAMGTFGEYGEFFVDGGGFAGQEHDASVMQYNSPPPNQPGLWCQWVPTADGTGIEWDGGEKFYDSPQWLKYIITNVLKPKGYVLNGIVEAQGEDFGDRWNLEVENNIVWTCLMAYTENGRVIV